MDTLEREKHITEFMKLAEAAEQRQSLAASTEKEFWEHYRHCDECDEAKYDPWRGPQLICNAGIAIQGRKSRAEQDRNKFDAKLGEYHFAVGKDMYWPDVFQHAVQTMNREWVAIEIDPEAKKLWHQACDVLLERITQSQADVPVAVESSLINTTDAAIVLIVSALDIRQAYENTRPKFAPPRPTSTQVAEREVNWDILPTGNREPSERAQLVRQLAGDNASTEITKIITERVEFFEALDDPKPQRFIKGRNSFSSYFGVQFSNELVAFENAREGNAIYIVFGKWEETSKYTKSELLDVKKEDRQFVRVFHRGDWKTRVIEKLRIIRANGR